MNYPYTRKRIAATFIDYALIDSLTIFYIVYFGEKQPDGSYSMHGFLGFLPMILWFFYFVVGERYGGTLGHRIFKLKVVTMDGRQPGLRRTLRRRFCDIFDVYFFFGLLGSLLIRYTQYHQRLGDIIAETRVIGVNDSINPVEFDFEKTAS
jgi:uncharacterized RDD family membrane protein YckC